MFFRLLTTYLSYEFTCMFGCKCYMANTFSSWKSTSRNLGAHADAKVKSAPRGLQICPSLYFIILPGRKRALLTTASGKQWHEADIYWKCKFRSIGVTLIPKQQRWTRWSVILILCKYLMSGKKEVAVVGKKTKQPYIHPWVLKVFGHDQNKYWWEFL